MLSHELRTPLTSAFGWVQMLRKGACDAETTSKALAVVDASLRTQNQLIEDLLSVSQIITGKFRIQTEMIDPARIVSQAIDAVRSSAAAKQVDIQFAADPKTGLISADPSRMQQIVWNLLSNSIKFTPKGGCVFI